MFGHRRTAIAALLTVYFVGGFLPFVPDPPVYVRNAVAAGDSGGWAFPAPGMARTQSPPEWLGEVAGGADLRLHLRFRPAVAKQQGPARILTVSRDFVTRNLMVGQDGDDVVVRLRRPGSDSNGYPPYRLPDMLADGEWHELEVAVAGDQLVITADGQVRMRESLGPSRLSDWDPEFNLAIGNELIGERAWLGHIDIATVFIDEQAYNYAIDEALYLPDGWWRIPPRLKDLFGWQQIARSDGRDVLVNLLGFVPLGLLLVCISAGRPPLWQVAGVAFVVSLGIETGQVFFAGRYPSLSDLVLNISGAAIGWRAAVFLVARRGPLESPEGTDRS